MYGVGSVGYSSLGGEVLGILNGSLFFANDVEVEMAGGTLCPIGQCMLVDCEKSIP